MQIVPFKRCFMVCGTWKIPPLFTKKQYRELKSLLHDMLKLQMTFNFLVTLDVRESYTKYGKKCGAKISDLSPSLFIKVSGHIVTHLNVFGKAVRIEVCKIDLKSTKQNLYYNEYNIARTLKKRPFFLLHERWSCLSDTLALGLLVLVSSCRKDSVRIFFDYLWSTTIAFIPLTIFLRLSLNSCSQHTSLKQF